MWNRIKRRLQNRRKPILGSIAWGVVYGVAVGLLNLDPDEGAGIASAASLIVVERVGPIFGETFVETPKPRGIR